MLVLAAQAETRLAAGWYNGEDKPKLQIATGDIGFAITLLVPDGGHFPGGADQHQRSEEYFLGHPRLHQKVNWNIQFGDKCMANLTPCTLVHQTEDELPVNHPAGEKSLVL
jgi:hypothetical protein